MQAVGYKKHNTLQYSRPADLPWLLKRPHINFSLHSSYKEDTPPEIFLNKFYELRDEYKGFCRLYTDGSLTGNRVACVVVSRTSSESVRLPNKSIFRAELHAIILAMRLIRKRKENNFIIFSDSISSLLQALNGFKLELNLIQKILKDYSHLTVIGKTVRPMLCWIPSHVNILGNEKKSDGEYRRVTDRQTETDIQTDLLYQYRARDKNPKSFYDN